ncbi:hypothetical protein GCM10023116_32820 [Kistimonas scapharcae]|uniref:Uncharacterized protein n=1 Tax=Kistimonas scapharcae TaxID=1036133 RepID=A0ABP8V6G2_9GAMM
MASTSIWKRFTGLLASPAGVVGTIVEHHSDGTSVVLLRTSSIIRAKGGSVGIGKKVFVEAGEVKREVPDLPFYDLEV